MEVMTYLVVGLLWQVSNLTKRRGLCFRLREVSIRKARSVEMLPVSAQEFPINRRIWIFKVCLSVCALITSRKKLRTPESPRGILHFAAEISVSSSINDSQIQRKNHIIWLEQSSDIIVEHISLTNGKHEN